MELALNRITNKKIIKDEELGIMKIYPDLIEDPKIKVKKMSDNIKLKLTIAISVLVVQVILLFLLPNPVFYAMLGGELVIIYDIYTQLEKLNNSLELERKKVSDQVLTITENKLILTDNITNRVHTVEWDKIKQILMTNNCICIMPEYVETQDMNAIIIPRDYEIEFLEMLKRINKDKLIVFN